MLSLFVAVVLGQLPSAQSAPLPPPVYGVPAAGSFYSEQSHSVTAYSAPTASCGSAQGSCGSFRGSYGAVGTSCGSSAGLFRGRGRIVEKHVIRFRGFARSSARCGG